MVGARSIMLATGLALAVDQGTKVLALLLLNPWPAAVPVFPVFNLVLLFNPGVTFGMLSGAGSFQFGPWLLAMFSLAMCGLLAWMARKATTAIEQVALGAAIGGALGNALDRVRQGAVTDFLDAHVDGWHWPAFNLADMAVVGGIAVYVAIGLLGQRRTGSA